MASSQATSHLDLEKWEQENEPEERGTFKTAPPRVVKKAVDHSTANSNPSRNSAEYPDEVGALNMAVVKFLQESMDEWRIYIAY